MWGVDLITDIADILLLNQEFEEALSWTYDHLDEYWRYYDYYLNLRFLLNKDISGKDIVRIGFSSNFRNNIGAVHVKKFYTPSMFAKRNMEEITKRCEVQFLAHKRELGNNYLKHLTAKHIDNNLPLGRYGTNGTLYRHIHVMFGGKYGKYHLGQEIKLQASIKKENICPDALDSIEGNWIHIDFAGCHELLNLISDLCTNCENELRKERGVPAIGEQWKSEAEIYALVKDILSNHEIIRHCSPEWLMPMHLDVYVPELSFAIEYQGEQHYKPVNVFGGKDGHKKTKVRDTIKKDLCRQNQLHLLEIKYDDEEPEKTIVDFIEKKLKVKIVFTQP
jgi:hypothetical protein